MSDSTDVLTTAIAAARLQDLDRLRGFVDWPLTGAATIGQALRGVLERDRAAVVASGLAELDAAATDPEIVVEFLQDVAPQLANAREIRRAEGEAKESILAALRIPEIPAGLTDEQHERLSELRERAAALRDVYLVISDQGELPVVRAADTDLLVLISG
jgi:hypothetical protein